MRCLNTSLSFLGYNASSKQGMDDIMATEAILNLEQLLSPISAEQPSGVDARADNTASALYYEIRDARNNARAIERNSLPGDHNDEHPEKEFWKLILDKAPEFLINQSKDLEVAAWLTEALTREDGFTGLRDGISLMNGLVKNFWDGLYPMPDEDGISTRIAVLAGLNGSGSAVGTLIAPINVIPLTQDSKYSVWSYGQALDLDKTTDAAAKKKKMEAGAVTLDAIKAAVKPSESEFYVELQDDLLITIAQFKELEDQLTTLCGDDCPPLSKISKAINHALTILKIIAKPILAPNDLSTPESDEMTSENTSSENMVFAEVKLTGSAKDRLEAFKHLKQLAEFFKRSEPHSPIGYTLERVIRWGDMSLSDLLLELIPDERSKDYYQKLVGIQPPPPPAPPMMGQPGVGGMPAYGQHDMMSPQPGAYDGGYNPAGGFPNQNPPAAGYDNPMFR